jgi:hypothetical protein
VEEVGEGVSGVRVGFGVWEAAGGEESLPLLLLLLLMAAAFVFASSFAGGAVSSPRLRDRAPPSNCAAAGEARDSSATLTTSSVRVAKTPARDVPAAPVVVLRARRLGGITCDEVWRDREAEKSNTACACGVCERWGAVWTSLLCDSRNG